MIKINLLDPAIGDKRPKRWIYPLAGKPEPAICRPRCSLSCAVRSSRVLAVFREDIRIHTETKRVMFKRNAD